MKILAEKQEATELFIEGQQEAAVSEAEARLSELEEHSRILQQSHGQIAAVHNLSDTELIKVGTPVVKLSCCFPPTVVARGVMPCFFISGTPWWKFFKFGTSVEAQNHSREFKDDIIRFLKVKGRGRRELLNILSRCTRIDRLIMFILQRWLKGYNDDVRTL